MVARRKRSGVMFQSGLGTALVNHNSAAQPIVPTARALAQGAKRG
jgi:hypothetical protein